MAQQVVRSSTSLVALLQLLMLVAIQPFHTIYGGDILYAVMTNEVENPDLDGIALGILASEVV